MRLRSLRSLTLAFLAAFLVATIGTGIALYSAGVATIARLVDRRIAAVSEGVAGERGARSRPAVLARIDLFARDRATGDIGLLLLDARGRRIGGNIALSRRLPPGYSSVHRDDRIAGLSAGRALVRDIGGGLTLVTVAETEPVDDYAAARLRLYLVGFGSIVGIVVVALLVFGLTVRQRIGDIRRTVDAIVDGDMQHRVPVDPAGGSFAEQARAFNRMLDRIAGLMTDIAGISSDVAHDLRTPLARLRSRLGLSLAGATTPAQRADIAEAIALCDELLATFTAILRIAEVEGGDRRAGFAQLDLADLADEIVATMCPVAAEDGRTLSLDCAAPVRITGDRQLLGQSLVNLIENTNRYTPAGSRIAITLHATRDAAILAVADDGPGIAVSDRARALRRFGRLDASRHEGGHGLGLPMVEAIVRLHRGTLSLEDARPGLRVVIALPLDRAEGR